MSKRPIATQRNFSISDASMLQDSRTSLLHFTGDQSSFSDFDPEFETPYQTEWAAANTAAGNESTDEQIRDIMTQHTADVGIALDDCRVHYQAAKYFIDKTFPDNTGVQKEFGYNTYNVDRQNADKMVTFMYSFHTAAVKYETELTDKGYNETDIPKILTLRTTLITELGSQQTYIANRGNATMERVHLMNVAWGYRKNVAKAAKQIYITNFAKYKIYLLPAGEEGPTTFIVSGLIASAITLVGLGGAIIEIGMDVYTADSNGNYGIAGLAVGSYSGVAKMTGYIDKPVTIVVGTTPSVVNVLLNTLV